MAYLIGLLKPEEVKELERRGWEVEPTPADFKVPSEALKDGLKYGMVYVDDTVLQIIGGAIRDKEPSKKVKVIVSDIKVTDREVELPSVCPKCGADLTDPDKSNLRVWGYSDQERTGYFPTDPLDADGSSGVFTGDVTRGGETFIDNVAIFCVCGHELVIGKFECVFHETQEATETHTYCVEGIGSASTNVSLGWILYDDFLDLPGAERCMQELISREPPQYKALRIVHTVKAHNNVSSYVIRTHVNSPNHIVKKRQTNAKRASNAKK